MLLSLRSFTGITPTNYSSENRKKRKGRRSYSKSIPAVMVVARNPKKRRDESMLLAIEAINSGSTTITQVAT